MLLCLINDMMFNNDAVHDNDAVLGGGDDVVLGS